MFWDLLSDSRFIDLYAGTGAVEIEALSRGAVEAVFRENTRPAVSSFEKILRCSDRSGAQVISGVHHKPSPSFESVPARRSIFIFFSIRRMPTSTEI